MQALILEQSKAEANNFNGKVLEYLTLSCVNKIKYALHYDVVNKNSSWLS